MGNSASTASGGRAPGKPVDDKEKYKSFPGSAFLEKAICGSIDTTDPAEYEGAPMATRLLKRADKMCISSPDEHKEENFPFDAYSVTGEPRAAVNPSSALLARALVSEVTDNPKTMTPKDMAAREKALLKAQKRAQASVGDANATRVVGGQGHPHVISSLAYALTGDDAAANVCVHPTHGNNAVAVQPGSLDAARNIDSPVDAGPFSVTIGLSLSRHSPQVGHADSVTRQTAFDFNELQDRGYKYVSSTDQHGWRAGGGEPVIAKPSADSKVPSPDFTHLPILHIHCQSQAQVDQVIHALASGEIFIPHMQLTPQQLSVNGNSPPDLVVQFGCERNDDLPPDEWNNWCLEFMHNQCYEYFQGVGAVWNSRPFGITLAKQVRWKTVKHMNRYFANAERVIDTWRENGPQTLDPELSYIQGGATTEEVSRPHGIYLLRNGVPTNYFGPNFEAPYTTKMTRSLLHNVLAKSWDMKKRGWSSTPMPTLVAPTTLMAAAFGCHDPTSGGFVAAEATDKTPHAAMNGLSLEEKKEDGVAAGAHRSVPKTAPGVDVVTSSNNSRYSVDEFSTDQAQSVAASGYAQSVAASGTTVMHNNKSVQSKQRLFADDDWAVDSNSPKDAKDALNAERQRQSELISKAKTASNGIKGGKSSLSMKPVSPNANPSPRGGRLEKDSVFSLDYSEDGSNTMFTQDGGSTLLGQHFAGDTSVSTVGRKEESTMDDGSEMLSIQESTSSYMSVVPTDEELFAVGWAKAMDSKSGNYYYFTLDRKTIVWENPLSTGMSTGMSTATPMDPSLYTRNGFVHRWLHCRSQIVECNFFPTTSF